MSNSREVHTPIPHFNITCSILHLKLLCTQRLVQPLQMHHSRIKIGAAGSGREKRAEDLERERRFERIQEQMLQQQQQFQQQQWMQQQLLLNQQQAQQQNQQMQTLMTALIKSLDKKNEVIREHFHHC